MKKIFTLLAISLVLVLPIVSCSADDESAKQAQTDRDSLEIPGDENNSSIQHNQLALYASATQVPVGTLVTFTTNLNGINVTNEVTYYVNNIEVGGNSIASTLNGTFQVQAKLEGYIDSPIVTVVYGNGTNPDPDPNPNPDPDPNPNPNPNPDPDPTGNFILNNQGYEMVINILILEGAFIDEGNPVPYSSWRSVVLNNTNLDNATAGAMIEFKTPFTITNPDTNVGTIVLPNGTNETYVKAVGIFAGNQNFENVVGTGTIHYTPNFDLGANTNPFTSTVSFNGNTLAINYNGAFGYVDQSEAARPNSQKTIKNIKLNSNKKSSFKYLNKLKVN